MTDDTRTALANRFEAWVDGWCKKECPAGCLPSPVQEHQVALFAEVYRALTTPPQVAGGMVDLESLIAKHRAGHSREDQFIALCLERWSATSPAVHAVAVTREEIIDALVELNHDTEKCAEAILALLSRAPSDGATKSDGGVVADTHPNETATGSMAHPSPMGSRSCDYKTTACGVAGVAPGPSDTNPPSDRTTTGNDLETTPAMRARLLELSTSLASDDYDRAVRCLLRDFDRLTAPQIEPSDQHVAQVLWLDNERRKIIDCTQQWLEQTPLGTKLYEKPQSEPSDDWRAGAEAAAKLIEPKGDRPCDCDLFSCYCGNSGDAQTVASWDADKANADRIRALTPPSKGGA